MRIGIIGAGQIGGTLTRRLAALGHELSVANSRGPETLAELASETGARAVPVREVVLGAELVVVTIPQAAVPELPDDLFAKVPQKVVVVDTGNYYPRERDGRIDAIEDGMLESRWVETRLGRPVVKAFNTIPAQTLMQGGRPAGSEDRVGIPVAGDREADRTIVLRLIEELGFDGIDAGDLDGSWRQQPGTPVYGTDLDAEGVRGGLAAATRERPAGFQATPHSPGHWGNPA